MMKLKLFMTLGMASIVSANVFAFDAKFVDPAWDGINVPAGQQCQKFGGKNPSTPELLVSGIPAGTNVLVLEYSDRNFEKMDNGGHGVMAFMLDASANQVTIPSVAGHTFDLPTAFAMVEAQRAPEWDTAGVYMPPCSGGRKHAYYVTIKATQNDKVLATTVVEMGKF